MVQMTSSHSSSSAAKRSGLPDKIDRFDPEEIRRIVQVGKDRGLISEANTARRVDKTGLDAAALGEVRSQWMDVDPDTARRWLENNFRNRPLSDDVVQAYARDMINGIWIATHQGIAFNDRDELIDGQHRLNAIVLSARTIRMMVTFGLPSVIEGKEMTTMDAVDRGRPRSVADQLKIQHKLKDGSAIAAICASLANICQGDRTRRLSVGQTLEIYRAFEYSVTWVIAHKPKANGLRAIGVLSGFAFALAAAADSSEALRCRIGEMFRHMVGGKIEDPRSPSAQLREFLLSDDAKLLNRGANRGLAELVLEAIRLELAGERVGQLLPSLSGLEHFRALQVERVATIAAMLRIPKPV